MSKRMYHHMKNTLLDIKTVIGRTDFTPDEKVRYISDTIKLLESVECGEVVTSGSRNDGIGRRIISAVRTKAFG